MSRPCCRLLQIDMQSKPDGVHARGEKYLLRKAFDVPEAPYLPDEVLYRQKEQFSDGVGYSWVDGLKDYAAKVRVGFRDCRVLHEVVALKFSQFTDGVGYSWVDGLKDYAAN